MSKVKKNYDSVLVLTNDLLGGKWKTRVLWHIIQGENRFSSLKKAIPEISEKVLYTILQELQESGLIHKEVVEECPPKVVLYHLHSDHKDLKMLLEAIGEFGLAYARKQKIQIG